MCWSSNCTCPTATPRRLWAARLAQRLQPGRALRAAARLQTSPARSSSQRLLVVLVVPEPAPAAAERAAPRQAVRAARSCSRLLKQPLLARRASTEGPERCGTPQTCSRATRPWTACSVTATTLQRLLAVPGASAAARAGATRLLRGSNLPGHKVWGHLTLSAVVLSPPASGPAAGMAQAPQPLAPLEEHDALPLALQHAALARRPRAVCALAATCRSLRAAVRQHCAGALVLRVQLDSEQQVARLAAWLAPNGRLLRELHLAKHCIGGIDARYSWLSVAPLAAALQQAAASAPGGLQLRALVTVGGLTGAGGLLAPWLPAQQLTRLELRLSSAEQLPPFSSSQVPVLAALTGLRQLMLPGLMGGDALLPALPGLSRLSALELSKLGDAAAIASLWEQLPAQLQRLTVRQLLPVRLGLSEQRPALALGRLSALTSLDADSLMLQPGDVLPPGLAELRGVCGAASVAPLLPLAQLRLLKWKGCQAPAAQLRQLSSVGALGRPDGELQLRFWSETAADAAAAAWPLLALRQLKVGDQQLAAATLQPLAQSTNLTRLRLNDVKLEAAPSRFAGAVQCLSRLVELELCFVFFQPEQPPPAPGNGARGAAAALAAATEAAGVQLVAAVARLPRLQALHLGALEPEGLCSAAAVVQLAAATGLTSLNLRDWTQMGDVGAAAVLPALRQLQELHVECYGLTDLAVVAGLSALTWLSIETSIEVNLDLTDAGIDCLIRGLPRVAAAAADAEADEA